MSDPFAASAQLASHTGLNSSTLCELILFRNVGVSCTGIARVYCICRLKSSRRVGDIDQLNGLKDTGMQHTTYGSLVAYSAYTATQT